MGASSSVVGLIVLLVIAGLILCGLIALIAGIVALGRINRSEGKLRGRGFAIAAIVIGLLLMLGLPVFGVIGGGFMRFMAGEAPQAPQREPARVHRAYSSDTGYSDASPAMGAEVEKRLKGAHKRDEVIIETDMSSKQPPAYSEKKKAEILENSVEQPAGKTKR